MQKFLLLLCLLPTTLLAWPRYQAGDTLYVGASSGLNLRDAVGLEANKLGTVPYGAAVVMLQAPRDGTTFEVEELPGFTISGLWIKVRYQGQEGYVFDGYLTRLPMPPQGGNRQDAYFGDILPKTQVKDVVHRYCLPPESDQPCHLTQYFAGPIIRSEYHYSEAAVQGTLWLPATTPVEAYLLMRALYYYPERHGIRALAEGHQRVLIFLEESVGCEVSLFLLPGGILIEYLCSC